MLPPQGEPEQGPTPEVVSHRWLVTWTTTHRPDPRTRTYRRGGAAWSHAFRVVSNRDDPATSCTIDRQPLGPVGPWGDRDDVLTAYQEASARIAGPEGVA